MRLVRAEPAAGERRRTRAQTISLLISQREFIFKSRFFARRGSGSLLNPARSLRPRPSF